MTEPAKPGQSPAGPQRQAGSLRQSESLSQAGSLRQSESLSQAGSLRQSEPLSQKGPLSQGGPKSLKAFGFPKDRRLRKRAEYLAMASKALGQTRLSGYLVVVRPNEGLATRLGVTATRKVGRAVTRNRLKRQAREFFRLNRAQWPEGLDVLFVASQKAISLWPPSPAEAGRLERFLRKFARPLAGPGRGADAPR
ncbi:MAG: ribonuclease P protein component [Deltaproteobacteria bacterium]|nr:ribonuclease P protein component [Deltaproteobacteria bacterium]